jgi:hypothetical protein
VQTHLWERGFPCPKPLGFRERVTLEEWREDGEYRDAHEPEVRRVVAGHLAELLRLTGELPPPPGLEPYFAPGDGPLWPRPHNVLFDFEATADGAEWIDEIAEAAKPLRDARVGRLVIGHGDWTVKHFRFEGLRPTVIYDWDSLNTDFETVFVGNSAATFTYTEHLPVPSGRPWRKRKRSSTSTSKCGPNHSRQRSEPRRAQPRSTRARTPHAARTRWVRTRLACSSASSPRHSSSNEQAAQAGASAPSLCWYAYMCVLHVRIW